MHFRSGPEWRQANGACNRERRVLSKYGAQIAPLRMSALGHSRRFDPVPATSGLSRTTDIGRPGRRVREVPGSDIVGLVWYEWGRFN